MTRSSAIGKAALACMLAVAVSLMCLCGLACEQAQAASVGKAKISSITAKYVGKATVKAKKVKGAKGYEFKIGTNKAVTKNVKKQTAKKAKATFKDLKVETKYYVKVRAYAKKNGKKVYGKWSKARSCKFTLDMDNYNYCMEQGDYNQRQCDHWKAKLRQENVSGGPGIYDYAKERADPTYRTRYYQQRSEHIARCKEAESMIEYYQGLADEYYAEATSKYWFIGYPQY